jgi:large subunit ribosomal protein L15
MQLHQIKPIHKHKKQKRIGHGGKRGTHSGRGIKGQKSRASRRFKPIIRELIKKYPKLRGYKFKSHKLKPAIVNLDILEKKFGPEEIISPQTLLEKRLIRKIKGRIPRVKILGAGEIDKAFIIESCQVSKNAEEKIKKAGGAIK